MQMARFLKPTPMTAATGCDLVASERDRSRLNLVLVVLFMLGNISSVEIVGGISVRTRTLIAVILFIFTTAGRTLAQGPAITSISPNSGPVGASVLISGSHFGSAQGSSTVTLNGTTALVASWSDSSVVAVVPANATSGLFAVTVGGQTANSSSFSVTSLPSGWSDGDVGLSV